MLIIAEKPNIAKDFAKTLNCSFKKNSENTGYYSDGKIDITNCIGHLFKLPEPDFYDEKFKSWKEIPCIPEKFSYLVDPDLKHQTYLVLELLKKHQNDSILIATDADREGEIIARECLICAGITDFSKIKRFWVSQALTPEVILEGIKNAKPLDDYSKLAKKGFARYHSDWLTGYNFTRYVSVPANKKLSIGRVRTAILSAIENRCSQIENFQSQKYYEYFGIFKMQRSTLKGIYFDSENKTQFSNRTLENELKNDINSKAFIKENKKEQKQILAPELYNLTSVQKDAFKVFGYSADKTLKIIQKLYEEFKCVSYPRTPSKVMGSSNVEFVKNIFTELSKVYTEFNEILKISDISLNNKRCFNDSKLDSHHALIPLKVIPENANEDEQNIYNLILNRFKIAFASPYIYEKQTVILSANNHSYKIAGKSTIDLGWKKFDSSSATLHFKNNEDENETEEEQSIDSIDWNNLILENVESEEKWTKPAKYFNEASILAFMENPKNVDESNEKLVGLGTQATRHTFIPELLNNEYIKFEKKNIVVTELGKTLINAVRNSTIKSFADISQTTDWEKQLNENPEEFENNIKDFIREAVKTPFEIKLTEKFQNKLLCPVCRKPIRFGKTKSGYKNWFCTGYADGCQFKIWESFYGTKLTEKDISSLCSGEKTGIKKFISKNTGKEFKAHLFLDSNFQIKFDFGK